MEFIHDRLLDKEILLEDAAVASVTADPVEIVSALEERTELLKRQLRARDATDSTTVPGRLCNGEVSCFPSICCANTDSDKRTYSHFDRT